VTAGGEGILGERLDVLVVDAAVLVEAPHPDHRPAG